MAIHLPIFTTLDVEGYQNIFTHAQPRFIFVSSPSLYKKINPLTGSLANFLKIIVDADISVGHMYAIIGSASGKAIMLFNFDDIDKAIEVSQKNGINLLTSKELRIYEPKG